MSKENPLKKEKRLKREELLKKGINPYPINYTRNHNSQSLKEKYQSLDQAETKEELCQIAGRIMRKRSMGKAAFFNVQDEQGEFQCYLKQDCLDEKSWQVWKLADIGDIVGIQGCVFRTKKGELSLRASSFQMLCKTLEPLPEKYHGLEDQELRYRLRHLDLIMNPANREVFKTRSLIIQKMRSFMHSKGFLEVETPVLQPIYGGAQAQPFTTHHRKLDRQMYLKISPEIYLKKLLVGGFEKVFEIGKNFRNEGIDRTHNPEFTMMEYYQAYTDYQYQMEQFEELVCFIVKSVKGSLKIKYQGKDLDFTRPWKRVSVKEALKEYADVNLDSLSDKDLVKKARSLDPKVRPEILEDRDQTVMHIFSKAVEPHFWQPIFITDFPIGVSPLTKKHRKWQAEGDKSSFYRIVERFEPMVAGMELGNAYTELNDPVDQKERLTLQEKQRVKNDESHPMDMNFIHALEVGLPPAGGVGLGIERLVMILTDRASIRDCIFFPVLKNKVSSDADR